MYGMKTITAPEGTEPTLRALRLDKRHNDLKCICTSVNYDFVFFQYVNTNEHIKKCIDVQGMNNHNGITVFLKSSNLLRHTALPYKTVEITPPFVAPLCL